MTQQSPGFLAVAFAIGLEIQILFRVGGSSKLKTQNSKPAGVSGRKIRNPKSEIRNPRVWSGGNSKLKTQNSKLDGVGRTEFRNSKSKIRNDMTTAWPRQASRNVIPSERSEPRDPWGGRHSELLTPFGRRDSPPSASSREASHTSSPLQLPLSLRCPRLRPRIADVGEFLIHAIAPRAHRC
jgi:hypothetical protein